MTLKSPVFDLAAVIASHSSPDIRTSRERCTYAESFMCVLTLPCAYLLSCLLHLRAPQLPDKWRFLLEHCFYALPIILTTNEFPVTRYLLVTFTFILSTVLVFLWLLWKTSPTSSSSSSAPILPESPHQALYPLLDSRGRPMCLTVFRGCVYIATCVAILARDLPMFHYDFSKTHSFGTGLMDVGIGCFVLAMGNLGPTARNPRNEVIATKVLRSTFHTGLILCICGSVRTLLVTMNIAGAAFDEYGKHWNVFFSLAAIKLAGTSLELVLPSGIPPIFVGLFIGLLYELLLFLGLASYILQQGIGDEKSRENGFMAANREGICALVGLLGLYFWGLQIGRWVVVAKNEQSERGFRKLLLKFVVTFLICALPINVYRSTFETKSHWLHESRRMGNFAYTLWIVSYQAFLTGFSLSLQLLVYKYKNRFAQDPSHKFESYLQQIDNHGLAYFLLGNILTGVINWLVIKPARHLYDDLPFYFTPIVLNIYMLVLPLGAQKISEKLLRRVS